MQGRIKKEIVIACEDKLFRIDDIVTIKTIFSKEYSGRIEMIGETGFMIDTSDKYRAKSVELSYEDVFSVEHCGQGET